MAVSRGGSDPSARGNERRGAFVLLLLVLAFRVWLCTDVPAETTDALRNLGYGSHLLDRGPALYRLPPSAFDPEPWTYCLRHFAYTYPPVTLCFFGVIGELSLGLFFAKLALTLLDLAVALVFLRCVSAPAAVAYLAMPASLWFVSHEGQFEPLVAALAAAAILFVRRRDWFWAGWALGLALQAKQLAVVLVPWIFVRALRSRGEDPPLRDVAAGLGVSILPFLAFHMARPMPMLAALATQDTVYNPFWWNPWDGAHAGWLPLGERLWGAAFTGAFLLLPLVVRRRSWRDDLVDASPWLLFWVLVKSLSWAQFWYVLVAPALLLCLEARRRLATVLAVLMVLQCGHSMAALAGWPLATAEGAKSRATMRQSLWRLAW